MFAQLAEGHRSLTVEWERKMRKFVLRAGLAGALLTLGACADSPTSLDQRQRAPQSTSGGPVLDQQPQGCVTEGICILPPIGGGACEEWDYSCDGGGNCAASAGAGGLASTTAQGCDDGGGFGGGYEGAGGGSGSGGGPGTKSPICPDTGCPSEPPSCDPRTDPNCEQPLNATDSTTITAALAAYVRPASEIPDTTARRQCAEMLAQFNASNSAGDVFRGGSNTTHYGATYNDRIHFDPRFLDAAANGNTAARREIATTALHEAAHVLGYSHPNLPTWIGTQDYYSDIPFNLLSPGANSCIRY